MTLKTKKTFMDKQKYTKIGDFSLRCKNIYFIMKQ